MNLRVPGPTPLPPSVYEAMTQPMIGHRTDDFRQLMAEVQQPLRSVFGTASEVLILTASGTGGLEAAVTNLLSPGDRVLAVSIGIFGQRFADTAEAFGAAVARLEFPMGQPAEPKAVANALKDVGDVKALLLTHNETSTGVANDVETIVRLAREARPELLVIVDGVSSVGAMPMQADAWGCDVVVTASQKALMAPPGMALLAVGPRAWTAMERAGMPRFYFDLREARRLARRHETPFTPAVSTLQGLRGGLSMLMAEGLGAAFARHKKLAELTRQGFERLGFRLVAAEDCASPTVTAAWVPEGISADALIARLYQRYQLALVPGHIKDRTIRLAHMGWVHESDIEDALTSIESALDDLRRKAK
jgi:aspartate aminotransferase-like enzyme